MLLSGQTQQLLVEQSQVTLQNQHYILQEDKAGFVGGQVQQQVFYMEDSGTQHVPTQGEPVTIQQQPVVLNHQLQGGTITTSQISGNPSHQKLAVAVRQVSRGIAFVILYQ